MNQTIDPQHIRKRKICRTIGIISLSIGGLFTAIGVGGFIISIALSSPSPLLIVFAFIGMPLLFVGTVLSGYGFMGAVARYSAQEMAPVAKDTFNYVADGTQEGVKTIATAIGQGIASGINQSQSDANSRRCPNCNFLETPDAKFCSKCGSAFDKSSSTEA